MPFSNPIQNVQVQPSVPAPQPSTSSVGDVVQLAQFGTNWLMQRQQLGAEQAKLQAQQEQQQSMFQSESLAVTRMNEAARIRQEKGAVHAQRYLDQHYRNDIGRMSSSEERKAYQESFRVMFGGSPTDEVQTEELRLERERQKRVDTGYDLLLGQGYTPQDLEKWTPDSLQLVSRMHDGRAAYLSQAASEASLEATQLSNQTARDSRAARYAMDVFNAGFSESIQDMRVNLINARTDEEYNQAKEQALNTLRNLRGNLRSEVSGVVNGFQLTDEAGNVLGTASAGDVSASDLQFYEARLTELQRWITGDFAREQNAEQVALFDSQMEASMRENATPHTLAMIAAGLHGQQANVNIGSEMFRGLAGEAMDYRQGIRVRVESENAPASQVVPVAFGRDAAPRVVQDLFREWSLLSEIEQTPEERKAAGRMAGNAIVGTFQGPNSSINLANSSKGVLLLHDKLAKDPQYASEVSAGIEEVAEQYGMTVDEMYSQELQSFTNRTLIPALRRVGGPLESSLLRNVSIEVRGGQIVFDSNASAPRRTDPATGRDRGNPAPRTAGGMPTGVGRASMGFQGALNKAARDLNTILNSYANVTGASKEQLLQQEAAELQAWLDGMFGREAEQPVEEPERTAPQRTTPHRTGVEVTDDGRLRMSF